MLFGIASSADLVKSALIASVHYISFMVCFGTLVFERLRVKPNPNRVEALSMIIADVVYGLAGLTLLISGILRVKYFGQGVEFYTHNPIFWIKIALFICVGLLSLYPTSTYIRWAIPLQKGDLPEVSQNLVNRLGLIINIELFGFASIPIFATFMARGIGLAS